MSAVVYRALDPELNLNESDKSWWGNTQTLIAGLCVGEANRRRDSSKKNSLQSVNQVQKDGYNVFFFVWLAQMIEGALTSLFFSFPFYDHCFIDKEDLLWEIQGKWRRYS